jgi:hypothetical protein
MRLLSIAIVSLSLALCSTVAVAGPVPPPPVLEIQFSGMDLIYNGVNLYDATSAAGGIGSPAQADPLFTMTFLVDGVEKGQLTTNIAIDTFIKALSGIPAAGGSVMTGGNGNQFGVDLLTKPAAPGLDSWGLSLNIDKMSFFYTGSNVAIATAGQSTSLWKQDLPFGLAFDPSQPISIVLSSASLRDVTTANGVVTGFRAAGTGNISGILLPEPTTMLLLALGAVGILRRRAR